MTYLSDEHLEALRFAAAEARRLGMRFDMTLTSGWPFGGPHIPVTRAAGKMRVEKIGIPGETLMLIAQPAEETITGAKTMIADGLFTL